MRLLVVSNETAQGGRNAKRIEQARRGLAERGFEADFLPTLPDGHTIETVRDALDGGGYRVAVAMGGDGTFREVASAILESSARDEVALGMLPTGTANDQGKSFGLNTGGRALERNLDVLVEGATTRLDAGRFCVLDDDDGVARESWFFDSAGFGLSARILRQRNIDRAWIEQTVPALGRVYRDQTVYAGATLKVLARSLVVADLFARVVADGVVHEMPHLTDLIVKNTRIYGGAWVLDPTSRHDDGLFEIIPLRGRRDWLRRAILDIEGNPAREVLLRALRLTRVPPIRAARIEVSLVTSGKLDAQIDGEETLATRRAAIEVVPRAIRLVVPRALAD